MLMMIVMMVMTLLLMMKKKMKMSYHELELCQMDGIRTGPTQGQVRLLDAPVLPVLLDPCFSYYVVFLLYSNLRVDR